MHLVGFCNMLRVMLVISAWNDKYWTEFYSKL